MSHLIPFLAIGGVVAVVSDRGLASVRWGIDVLAAVVRGLFSYLRALSRWYARLAFGSAGQ